MTENTQPFEKGTHRYTKRQIITNNFLGGIFWAVGVTIGFSLLVALLTLFSKYINLVPIIGVFVSDILDFVLSYNQHFPKP
ncbi:MAG: DUF5665 domain-containing protein [Patescibacteria group bacterium]